MNNKEINQILELNKQFYQSVSNDFSKTRQKPWEGWGRATEILKKYFHISEDKSISKIQAASDTTHIDDNKNDVTRLIDLGCGNGRFYDFLSKNISNFHYTGVDTNNDLINEAKQKYGKDKNAKFIKKDVVKNIEKFYRNYDVITAFGLTHHIPSSDLRNQWFSNLPKILDPKFEKSLIILTFWDFEKKAGDYLIGWDKKPDVARFCHKYSKEELDNLISNYKNLGFKLLSRYKADNKNLYLIFGKI